MAAVTTDHHSAPPLPPQPPLYSFGVPWPDLNEGLLYTDLVRSTGNATTLIEFYSSKYKNSAPLQGWLQRIRNRQITVDGGLVTDPCFALRDGAEVVYHRLPWKEPFAPYLLEVLYEDNDMVAINKPSGLQVLPGGLFQQRTVLMQLQWKEWNKVSSDCSKRQMTQETHPVPVHRLGRGTSGILLCAKTKLAKTRLSAYFANGTAFAGDDGKARRISKVYRALVAGVIARDEFVIKQPIGTMHYPGVAKGLYVASSSGKPALSKVQVLERDAQRNQAVVQVEIHSGRPHQIRIHLAFAGHPLIGDPLYDIGGQPKAFEPESSCDCAADDGGYQKPVQAVPGDCGYYLHAYQLFLSHPVTNKRIEITASLPPILQTQEERDQENLQR
uniref:Pseudouridine synthase RsuA/RluA-like domain-containing protein n=1 Tax=Musa acuminata subsp. malaccensis TaxID=214687 RepID=A0A804LAZ1_MUSAM|nr:PREDICTED: RNA pseudouridine synthase 5 [Musa acuminata subsp. malaccensis]